MTKNHFLALWMAGMCLPVLGQALAENHYPITPRLVARALSNSGMQTDDEQVSLPAQVVATEQYPELDILSVEPLANANNAGPGVSRSNVRLACHAPGSCLPFFAIVTGAKMANATAGAAPKTKPAITMRAGARAILVMDDHRAHIQVAVISLENGVTGKWIRVASPDHKQTYWGEVVSANELRGNF